MVRQHRLLVGVGVALVAWSFLIAIVWLTKGGHIVNIGRCPTPTADGCMDSDLPQLLAWGIGAVVIVLVALVVRRRHSPK